MAKKNYALLLIGIVLLTWGALGCSGLRIKIYKLDPEKTELVREQEKEHIPVKDAKGFYCLKRDHLKMLIDAYDSCKETCKP